MATPYDAPIPGASGYADAALQAKTAYQNALARINSKRSDTLRQYGYLGDIDPSTGVLSNIRVDPYNQYGGLQSLLRNNAQSIQDARFAAEDRGLHGGLAHKAISDVHYDFGNASQQLGSAFSQALGGYQDDQDQAAYRRDSALYQAELDAARLAIENQQFNPGGDDSGGGGGGGGGNDNPPGGPSEFQKQLIQAGVKPKLAPTVDPGIAAAIVANAAAKAKKSKGNSKAKNA